MYSMFYASRQSTISTRNVLRHLIFTQTGQPRRVGCLAPLCKYRREVSFPEHNDALLSSKTLLWFCALMTLHFENWVFT